MPSCWTKMSWWWLLLVTFAVCFSRWLTGAWDGSTHYVLVRSSMHLCPLGQCMHWWAATYSLGATWRWLLGWFLDSSLQCLNSAHELDCVGWIHLSFLLGGWFMGSCCIHWHGFQLKGGHFAISRVQEAEGNNFMDARTTCLFQI